MEHLTSVEKLAPEQAAGWSKIQHPKGVASSGLAFQDIQSDRWDQQQGILGLRPTQKSRRAGIGLLRSVFQSEDPLQLGAVFSPRKEG